MPVSVTVISGDPLKQPSTALTRALFAPLACFTIAVAGTCRNHWAVQAMWAVWETQRVCEVRCGRPIPVQRSATTLSVPNLCRDINSRNCDGIDHAKPSATNSGLWHNATACIAPKHRDNIPAACVGRGFGAHCDSICFVLLIHESVIKQELRRREPCPVRLEHLIPRIIITVRKQDSCICRHVILQYTAFRSCAAVIQRVCPRY